MSPAAWWMATRPGRAQTVSEWTCNSIPSTDPRLLVTATAPSHSLNDSGRAAECHAAGLSSEGERSGVEYQFQTAPRSSTAGHGDCAVTGWSRQICRDARAHCQVNVTPFDVLNV